MGLAVARPHQTRCGSQAQRSTLCGSEGVAGVQTFWCTAYVVGGILGVGAPVTPP